MRLANLIAAVGLLHGMPVLAQLEDLPLLKTYGTYRSSSNNPDPNSNHDSATPSVDAALGDFSAVGHGMERPVTSEVARNGPSGRSRNCYWAMPFRKSCNITVTNESRRRVSNLQDPDPNVRLMSAQAIGRNRKAALPAVPALAAACRVKGEQVHVLRSLVTALGEIGPDAAPALPEIRALQKIPGVRWPADGAIKRIEAK